MASTETTTNIINEASKSVFSTDTIGPFMGALVVFIAVFYMFFYLTNKQTRSIVKENNVQNQEMMKLALDSSAKTSLEVGRTIAKELITSMSEHFNENSKKLDRHSEAIEQVKDSMLIMETKLGLDFKLKRKSDRDFVESVLK